MRAFTVALAITILVPVVVSGLAWLGRCSENAACPTGSECVDGFCVVCSVDRARCVRSVDRCKALNCASDEGCYVSEQENQDGTVALKLVCAKTNPCVGATCQNGNCQTVITGNQPPWCRTNTPVNPCNNANCPNGFRCLLRAGLCSFHPCLLEGLCVDLNDCASCNFFYQYCEVTVKDNTIKGSCLNFIQPFMLRTFILG